MTKSVTMNFFRKKYFLFKSFVKAELSFSFTINLFSTAENCMKKYSLVGNYLRPSNNSRQLIFNINDVVLMLIIC